MSHVFRLHSFVPLEQFGDWVGGWVDVCAVSYGVGAALLECTRGVRTREKWWRGLLEGCGTIGVMGGEW